MARKILSSSRGYHFLPLHIWKLQSSNNCRMLAARPYQLCGYLIGSSNVACAPTPQKKPKSPYNWLLFASNQPAEERSSYHQKNNLKPLASKSCSGFDNMNRTYVEGLVWLSLGFGSGPAGQFGMDSKMSIILNPGDISWSWPNGWKSMLG